MEENLLKELSKMELQNMNKNDRSKNDATISGMNTAEICAMGRKGHRNIEIKATEPEEWGQ